MGNSTMTRVLNETPEPPTPLRSTPKDIMYKHVRLENYRASISVVYKFWHTHVTSMSRTEQQHLAILNYSHVFLKLPSARRLFVGKSIEEQSEQFLDMFGWLIRRLHQSNRTEQLCSKLAQLGSYHVGMGVKREYFEIFLSGLHASLEDCFRDLYTLRVRFCLEQIFVVVANMMNHNDFRSLFSAGRGDDVEEFLVDFETCLRHPVGTIYLQKYMQDSFCLELYLFEQAYREYTAVTIAQQRDRIGREIIQKFIDFRSPCEVFMPYEKRITLLREAKLGWTDTLFDEAHLFSQEFIEQNIWCDFTSSFCGMLQIENTEMNKRISRRLSQGLCAN